MSNKKRKIGDLLRSDQAKRFRSSYDLLDDGSELASHSKTDIDVSHELPPLASSVADANSSKTSLKNRSGAQAGPSNIAAEFVLENLKQASGTPEDGFIPETDKKFSNVPAKRKQRPERSRSVGVGIESEAVGGIDPISSAIEGAFGDLGDDDYKQCENLERVGGNPEDEIAYSNDSELLESDQGSSTGTGRTLATEKSVASFSNDQEESWKAAARYKPSTVSRPRVLKLPVEEADLSRSDSFIDQFLLSILGPREFALFKSFKSFYSRARDTQNRTVFYRRPDLERLLGTTSSSTVTRTLKRGASLGFFEVQSFSFRSHEIQAGTYIHLRSPWNK